METEAETATAAGKEGLGGEGSGAASFGEPESTGLRDRQTASRQEPLPCGGAPALGNVPSLLGLCLPRRCRTGDPPGEERGRRVLGPCGWGSELEDFTNTLLRGISLFDLGW